MTLSEFSELCKEQGSCINCKYKDICDSKFDKIKENLLPCDLENIMEKEIGEVV